MAVQVNLHHMTSIDDQSVHHMCPEGKNSWSSYNKPKALNELDEYQNGFDAIPQAIVQFSNRSIIDWLVDSFCLNPYSNTLRIQTNFCTLKCVDSVPNACFWAKIS